MSLTLIIDELDKLAGDELLVMMDSIIFDNAHIFRRADKMAMCLLFKSADGHAHIARMLPWRSNSKPHKQTYMDSKMVKVAKDDPGKFHGRVLPEYMAVSFDTSPASYVLAVKDQDHWPCGAMVQDMRRTISKFTGDVRPWAGLPDLYLSCREGTEAGLVDSKTLKGYTEKPILTHENRDYYPFSRCFGRGVLVSDGNEKHAGVWMKTDINTLAAYDNGYMIQLPVVYSLMQP